MTLESVFGGAAVALGLLAMATSPNAKDIVETAVEAGRFDTLVTAVQAADPVAAL